jgi:hypothetical protein
VAAVRDTRDGCHAYARLARNFLNSNFSWFARHASPVLAAILSSVPQALRARRELVARPQVNWAHFTLALKYFQCQAKKTLWKSRKHLSVAVS